MKIFDDLSIEEKQWYCDKVCQFLYEQKLLYCTRSWNAWNTNTMTSDDYYEASCDDDINRNLAILLYESVHYEIRKMKIKNIVK